MKRFSLALALALLTPQVAAANPLDEFGFGARGIALGGAATALADDFSATYYNPAGLAVDDTLRLELGYAFHRPRLTLNDGDLDVDASRGLQGGLLIPGKLLSRRIAVALGLHLPDNRLSRIRALPQSQPRFVLYDNRPQRIVISIAAGVEVFDDLHIGGGLTFLSGARGGLDIDGLLNISRPERTQLFTAVNVDLRAVRYANFGVLYTPGDNWRFGATFRDAFTLTLDLTVNVAGDVTLGPEDAVAVENASFGVRAFNSNLFSPRQVAFGTAYVTDDWTISVDVAWLQWSRFPPPASRVDIDLDLGDFEFTLPPTDVPIEPDFRDIIVPRVGAELVFVETDAVKLVARAGYFFEMSPAPAQPAVTNYVDSDRHGLSVGLGVELGVLPSILPRPLVIDLAGQAILLADRTYQKDDPADPVGDFVAGGSFVGAAVTTRLMF